MTFRQRLIGTLRRLQPVLDEPGVLVVEKLLTDRTGEKGVRDLLVVAGLLSCADADEVAEVAVIADGLSLESRHAISANLTLLSLMETRPGMPDPAPVREQVARLLAVIEAQRG